MAPGKKARAKAEEIEAAEAQEALSRIDCQQAVSEDLLLKIHRLQVLCPSACGTKGSKDNPLCFCNLIPQEGSFRKKGLWQKEPVLGQIGRDPAEDGRKGPNVPAGLRNLGNTCYVNAAMQFLFANPDFRHALYMLEPHIAAQDIVKQMRSLCIEHQFGPRSCADPEPFANILQLNHAIQQDGQEFLKLLLQKLEHIFAASKHQEVATVVQRLFRGYFSYVTTCRNCQQPSEGSKRMTEYYELPVQVVGVKTLQQSMACALASEELIGDNQYFCDLCGKKCDAERQMRLRSLPPYLCMSLQRFIFDFQTMDKKKVTEKISIPLLLDLGEVVASTGVSLPEEAPKAPDGSSVVPGADCAQYELTAVLIHKGTSASHGHYVAHIKMPDTGMWWRFDDEVAEEMGPSPTSHPVDHGTTAQAQAAAAGAASAADDSKTADGKSKASSGKAKRSKKDTDSDFEVSAASRKKSRKGSGAQGRGKGRGRGRGRGSKSQQQIEGVGNGFTADHDGVEPLDEESQLQEALRLSREEVVREQATAWSSLQSQQQALAQQDAQQQWQQQLELSDTAAVGKSAGRKRKSNSSSECSTVKKATKRAGVTEEISEAAPAADETAAQNSKAAGTGQSGDIISGNAYFVVYRQRISTTAVKSELPVIATSVAETTVTKAVLNADADVAAAVAGRSNGIKTSDAQLAAKLAAEDADGVQVQLHPQLLQQLQPLPQSVYEQVMQQHKDFADACRCHQNVQQDALARITRRQQEVRSVYQLLRCSPEELSSGCFVPSSWLDTWASSDTSPGPIDNGQLLCEHHKLKLDKPGSMKFISSAAWDALVSEHKGGPQLHLSDTCPICLAAHLQRLLRSDYLQLLKEEILNLLVDDQQLDTQHDVGFYVSKSWLTGFRNRQRVGGGSLQPPTAGITCCHGQLAPEGLATSSRRVLVAPRTWDKLKDFWVTQVLREVAVKRKESLKAAAAKALAATNNHGDVAHESDDEVKIVSPDKSGPDAMKITRETESPLQKQQCVEVLEPQDEQQQQSKGHKATPPAPVGWQFPLKLDGSLELTDGQLRHHLPEFNSAHAVECRECATSLQEAAAGHQEFKQQLDAQRATFAKLLNNNVQEMLDPGVTYYLVPNDWLRALRLHLGSATQRRPSSTPSVSPPPLPDAIRGLLCQCHPEAPGLTVSVPSIINRRGRFAQADPEMDALRVVTEQDWHQLLLYYSGLPALDGLSTSQQTEAAGPAAGRKAGKGSRSQLKQQQQEQLELLLQAVESVGVSHSGYHGIKATLQLQTMEASSNQPLVCAAEQETVAQRCHLHKQLPAEQQQQHGVTPAGEQQQPADQQQCSAPASEEAVVGAAAVQVQQQQLPQQVASVDLTVTSPAADRYLAATEEGLMGDVQLVQEKQVQASALTADNWNPPVDQHSNESHAAADGDDDPAGLLDAALNKVDNDWQPGCSGSSKQRPTNSKCSTAARSTPHSSTFALEQQAPGTTNGGVMSAQAVAALEGWLLTEPGPCVAVLDARAAEIRAARLVYTEAEVIVEVIQEADLATAFDTAERRSSRRTRKGRQPVKMSSSDTLAQLKLKVFEVMGIHPKNQKLYARSMQLEGDQQTMAQLEIFPDEEIRVVNTNEVPDDDYASVFDGVATGKRKREVEIGFRDTALATGPMQSVPPSEVVLAAQPTSEVEAQQQGEGQPSCHVKEEPEGTTVA